MESSIVIRLVVIGVLLAIVASMGSALLYLVRGRSDKDDSKKMARSLTIRVGLSLGLFLLLMIAWLMGIIQPHDIEPPRPR
jgi:hypothetical protein